MEQQKLHKLWMAMKNGTTASENSSAVSYQLKHTLTIHPCNPIYPEEMNIYVHTKTCTHMFIATLFIIIKGWK